MSVSNPVVGDLVTTSQLADLPVDVQVQRVADGFKVVSVPEVDGRQVLAQILTYAFHSSGETVPDGWLKVADYVLEHFDRKPATSPRVVIDGVGDTWYLTPNGKYSLRADNGGARYTLDEIRADYGIRETPAVVIDGEGDTWRLRLNGKYSLNADGDSGYYALDQIRTAYGIRGTRAT